MKVIGAEDFLKQPEEIQKIFINWWKCELGDLFIKNVCIDDDCEDIECLDMDTECDIEGDWEYFKTVAIPLLSEGQLREFIEDKTGHKVDCCFYEGKYDINICEYNGLYIKKYKDVDSDLLQAYWKVAIQIVNDDKEVS